MASKVMVNLPVAPFGQVNKSKSGTVSSDIVMARPNQDTPQQRNTTEITKNDAGEGSRVAQLEQNIKFLQEQHALMLNGLHNEIESLKIRNRELQFQLIFANKGSTPISSPSSSSEDDSKHKVYSSPQPLNDTPLQVEILEKELGELKIQLQEAEKRNVYFSTIVDEQKKKLESYESTSSRNAETSPSAQADPDLARRLDDAEALIRRLRRENSDIKREYHHSYNNGRDRGENGYQGGSRGSGRGNRGGNEGQERRHKGGGGNGHYRTNWFPPLHTQSYWQHGGGRSSRSVNDNVCRATNVGVANTNLGGPEEAVAITGAALPALGGGGDRRASNNNHHHHNNHHQQHHYSNGGGKYHRGGGGQKKQT
ncbi:unnamed protein product [Acanthoscelides obtectus]|uniref:CCDC92/74 N-terminal domain-containing protein n=1 Tax=Acanthoscelides obtectus TaxID=200917 RepID=A0A9P0JYY8_ACAOB|nr:unnamed protein product [Acanthoscelides obtectus]CAK1638107.1 hypothetical protein AOBTE_LOCUS10390 [Acanthoscelides obtectus]